MDAKAMKKVSHACKQMTEAQNGVRMGNILKAIIDTAVEGKNSVVIEGIEIDASLEKYITGLGYKVEKETISW